MMDRKLDDWLLQTPSIGRSFKTLGSSSSISSARPLGAWLLPLLFRVNFAGIVAELLTLSRDNCSDLAAIYASAHATLTTLWPLTEKRWGWMHLSCVFQLYCAEQLGGPFKGPSHMLSGGSTGDVGQGDGVGASRGAAGASRGDGRPLAPFGCCRPCTDRARKGREFSERGIRCELQPQSQNSRTNGQTAQVTNETGPHSTKCFTNLDCLQRPGINF